MRIPEVAELTRAIRGGLAVLLIGLVSHTAAAADYDLVVRGGTVIDGAGGAPVRADVGVRGSIVVAVGAVVVSAGSVIIDATGKIVAPGFIDAHNHLADTVARAPAGPSLYPAYLSQGVTTIVAGPDGEFSPADIQRISRHFKEQGVATNYAFYVGHNGIRAEVMGGAQRAPTTLELRRMKRLAAEGMEMGAVGLSTGLMYEPGLFSDSNEVIELAKVVQPYDGLYDSHTRDPVMRFLESDEEAIQIGRAAGIRVKIAHEKAVGLQNRGKIRAAIAMIEAERARGLEVVTDQYPYDGATVMSLDELVVLP